MRTVERVLGFEEGVEVVGNEGFEVRHLYGHVGMFGNSGVWRF